MNPKATEYMKDACDGMCKASEMLFFLVNNLSAGSPERKRINQLMKKVDALWDEISDCDDEFFNKK